jgi:hypothetical protein
MFDSNNPIHDRRNGAVGTASQHLGGATKSPDVYHVKNTENPHFDTRPEKYYDNKKQAQGHVDTLVKAGYTPKVTKYPGGDYSKGKPAMGARIATKKFFSGQ